MAYFHTEPHTFSAQFPAQRRSLNYAASSYLNHVGCAKGSSVVNVFVKLNVLFMNSFGQDRGKICSLKKAHFKLEEAKRLQYVCTTQCALGYKAHRHRVVFFFKRLPHISRFVQKKKKLSKSAVKRDSKRFPFLQCYHSNGFIYKTHWFIRCHSLRRLKTFPCVSL